MLEDVHNQLGFVGVGNVQFIAAVGQGFSLLLRVPLFVGNPAGTVGGEAQYGGVSGFTCKNAVAGGEMFVEFGFRYFACDVSSRVEGGCVLSKNCVARCVVAPGIGYQLSR